MFCAYTWPRYQVSIHRTIGPLVCGSRHTITSLDVICTAIFKAVKTTNFQMKNCEIFPIFAPNIDCKYAVGPPHSNEYPQSSF